MFAAFVGQLFAVMLHTSERVCSYRPKEVVQVSGLLCKRDVGCPVLRRASGLQTCTWIHTNRTLQEREAGTKLSLSGALG